jgi:type I restriction enzyme M protein
MSQSTAIVQRLWNYCNVLRDDGISYGDYLEQLTFLLFLKMDQEREQELGESTNIPADLNWTSLTTLDGDRLKTHYRHILTELGRGSGLIPVIFRKAQNRIQDPAKLKRLVSLIEGETWLGLGIDVKADIYERLLEKNAQDIKSGAGQYFTPRPLIQAIVDVMQPHPRQRQFGYRSRRPLFNGLDQSTLWQKEQRHLHPRHRRNQTRSPNYRPQRFLDLDQQQAAQLCAARQNYT